MKFSVTVIISLLASFFISSTVAASAIPQEMREDAEYMMRKVVEDIHQFKVRSTVTDITRDKGIKVVGYALKFIPEQKDKTTGEIFSCARVSLKANLKSGKTAKAQIKRTDEICTGKKSGRVKYVANIR